METRKDKFIQWMVLTLQSTACVNVSLNELMVRGFLIPKSWRAVVILKRKVDEMVTAFRGKMLNSYFSDITKRQSLLEGAAFGSLGCYFSL